MSRTRLRLLAVTTAALFLASLGSPATALGTSSYYLCNGGDVTSTFYGKTTSGEGMTQNANGRCGANVKVNFKRPNDPGTIWTSEQTYQPTTARTSPGGVISGTHWPTARLAGQPIFVTT